jgi:hypothetical protein
VNVHQILVLAERYALTSGPPDYVETSGLGIFKTPAPQDPEMSMSILHKNIQSNRVAGDLTDSDQI